jgi:hypothetical protein
MKRLLLVFLLLSPASILRIMAAVEDYDTIPGGAADMFMLLPGADTSELPDQPLLQIALEGYELLLDSQSVSRTDVITIIDFSLPSDKERLWVLDLLNGKVLFHCLVSHGRNSGGLTAVSFSNVPGSNASSPGFYTTGETYYGKHGLSLMLDGLEEGINDNARRRSIVMHGADYVSDDFIRRYGRLGRSYGCPAVPVELNKEIIETIKGGSCLFIYIRETSYASDSSIIKRITAAPKV